jgi:hypothetical protein
MEQHIDDPAIQQTKHMRTRCQQRGVNSGSLRALLGCADCLVHVGGNCSAMTLSRAGVATATELGYSHGEIDRARRRAVIVDGEGVPVTILVPSGKRGRRYRRG